MKTLDRHVAVVRSKLVLARFIDALSWTTLYLFAAIVVAVLVERLLRLSPPGAVWFLGGGAVVAVALAMVWAARRRPSAHEAAVAIDERLGLHEAFSTALYVRGSADPFAAAAVRNAERAADTVSMRKRFPLKVPRLAYVSAGVAVVALLVAWLVPPLDLLGRESAHRKLAEQQSHKEAAKRVVAQALATVNAYPKAMQDDPAIRLAKRDLQDLMAQPVKDPTETSRKALRSLDDVKAAMQEQIKNNEHFAQAQSEQQMFKSMTPTPDETGSVADAQRSLAKADFSAAAAELRKATEQFDKMSSADQAKTADQMQRLAQQLQQMAQDPARQQQLQQKLQQAGLTSAQAKQLQQAVQQAANGDKQSQQRLQQLQKQLMQQASPQARQQAQQLMKQMQASAQTQSTAGQMSAAAQKMAQAMQQQAQQQQQQASVGQQSKQGQQSQQAQQGQQAQQAQQQAAQSKQGQGQQQAKGAQQSQQAMQGQKASQSAQAAGQSQQGSQAGGQKSGQGQQGQQGQQSGQGQQAMADASKQMQQQMDQMDAVAQDAQAAQAAQQATDQAADNAADQASNSPAGGKSQSGDGQGLPGGQGQFQPGQAHNRGNGMGGPGIGRGGRGEKAEAPYAVKKEVAPTQDIESGRVLASTYVKAGTVKGDARARLENVAKAAVSDTTDDVDEQAVSKDAQGVVRNYFQTMEKGQ